MQKLVKLDNKAFTLVEIILVIVIITIVLSIAAAILIQVFNIVAPSNERMSTRQLAEINITTLAAYLRNAEEIDSENDIIKVRENGNLVEIKLEGNTITKMGNQLATNINEFEVDLIEDNLYLITLEKCSEESCNTTVVLKEEVLLRN